MVAVGSRHGGRASRDVGVRLGSVRRDRRRDRDGTTGRAPRTGGPPVSEGWDGASSGGGWDATPAGGGRDGWASSTAAQPPLRRHSQPRHSDDVGTGLDTGDERSEYGY